MGPDRGRSTIDDVPGTCLVRIWYMDMHSDFFLQFYFVVYHVFCLIVSGCILQLQRRVSMFLEYIDLCLCSPMRRFSFR